MGIGATQADHPSRLGQLIPFGQCVVGTIGQRVQRAQGKRITDQRAQKRQRRLIPPLFIGVEDFHPIHASEVPIPPSNPRMVGVSDEAQGPWRPWPGRPEAVSPRRWLSRHRPLYSDDEEMAVP